MKYKIIACIKHPDGSVDFLPDDNGACFWSVYEEKNGMEPGWLADFWDKIDAEAFIQLKCQN